MGSNRPAKTIAVFGIRSLPFPVGTGDKVAYGFPDFMRPSAQRSILLLSGLVFLGGSLVLLRQKKATPSPSSVPAAPSLSSEQRSAEESPKVAPPKPLVGLPVALSPEQWREQVAAALSSNAVASGKALAQLLNNMPKDISPSEMTQTLSAMVKKLKEASPAENTDFVKELALPQHQQLAASGIAHQMARQDPKAASEWAASLDGHDMGRTAYQIISREWAGKSRGDTVKWIESINNPLLQGAAAEGLSWTWSQQDLPGLAQWAAQIEDNYVQTAVIVKAAKMLALKNPKAAAEWAIGFPEGMARRQAVATAASVWAGHNAKAASEWVSSLSPTDGLQEAQLAVGKSWLADDPDEAKPWIATLPAESQKQIEAFVKARPSQQ